MTLSNILSFVDLLFVFSFCVLDGIFLILILILIKI